MCLGLLLLRFGCPKAYADPARPRWGRKMTLLAAQSIYDQSPDLLDVTFYDKTFTIYLRLLSDFLSRLRETRRIVRRSIDLVACRHDFAICICDLEPTSFQ